MTGESRWPVVVLFLVVWLGAATLFVNHHVQGARQSRDFSEAAPKLGVLINSQMQVLSVDQDSPAARAGIESGDILGGLGNKALPRTVKIVSPDTILPIQVPATISTTADIRALFHALVPPWEHTLSVIVGRHGRTVTIPVFVTAQPDTSFLAHDYPTVTPVPQSMDTWTFYL